MAKKRKPDPFKQLSRREREILEIIHRLEKATVSEIIDAMDKPPTRPAVRALLTVMEKKKYVSHTKSGREFVYTASIAKEDAAAGLLQSLINNFFGGSLKNAVATHLAESNTEYSEAELKDLTEIVDQARKQER
ncbi:MAG: BlaI/MecI/CopY family transcriptional regulator [Limisphaerales bacterium]